MSYVDDVFGSKIPEKRRGEADPRIQPEMGSPRSEQPDGPTWFVLEVEPEPMNVVGVGNPPRSLTGVIRRHAFRHPEYHARRWMLLGLAERIDRLKSRLSSAAFAPLFWILRANRRRTERRRVRAHRGAATFRNSPFRPT